MTQDCTHRDLRATALSRLARRIHPHPYPTPLARVSPSVLAEAIPVGIVDAMLAGRIDVPVFRSMFHALCPPQEAHGGGLARVAMAMECIGQAPAVFVSRRLLTDPLYDGQGMITDRRIWAAAATCPHVEADDVPRFEPMDLALRAANLPLQLGLHSKGSIAAEPVQLARNAVGIDALLLPALEKSMGAQANRQRLAMAVAWGIRCLVHGRASSPAMTEVVALRDELLRSPLGFETHVEGLLLALEASRTLNAGQVARAMTSIRWIWRECH